MGRLSRLVTIVGLVSVMVVSSSVGAASPGDAGSDHRWIFAEQSRPYGTDIATWGERLTQWIYGSPYDRNPAFDQTGQHCAAGQEGPVWFIPPIFTPPGTPRPIIQDATRACTIPRHKAVLLDIGALVNSYPCPDEGFHPAPGQSLYDFLIETGTPIMDTVNMLDVTIDGHRIRDVLGYRYTSDDLFTVTGDVSLQGTYDSCITGEPQPAIMDGFFVMLKPLKPGSHRIVVHGTNTRGDDRIYRYHLTVR